MLFKRKRSNKSLLPKTEGEKVDLLFAKIKLDNKCRLFYSADKRNIVYIYMRDDGFFSVGKERLVFADEEEIKIFQTYGWWEDCNTKTSIYDTQERAYNDVKCEFADYLELSIG